MGEPMTRAAQGATAPAAVAYTIMPAAEADWPGIWQIFRTVVAGGDTYSYAADTSEDLAREMWIGAGKYGTGALGYVVKNSAGLVIGTYSLRRNHLGHGSHVANAGYMVHPDHRRQGVARAMCLHSLTEAARIGCRAMQFNYVVSTNSGAVALWESLGFRIIGISPGSFAHRTLGYVDIYIMHRFLDGVAHA